VEFKTAADAEKAVKELTNTELGGRKIFVREVCGRLALQQTSGKS
jgi:RNA recognition motif-containing protein